MRYSILFIVIAYFLASSCTTSKILTSGLPPSEISNLKLLEPRSHISIITKGNQGEINDSLCMVSSQLLMKVTESFMGQLPLTGNILLSDPETNTTLEKEYESLLLTAEGMKDLSHLQITPVLDKVLEANETRFGLVIVSSGFTRIKGNYGKQIVKGAAIGLLTLGMYAQTPVKANSIIYAMIVDSEENNVAFFRKSTLQDSEPLDKERVTRQLRTIFSGYFPEFK